MLHIGKLDRCCTDLQMKERNRALMNGDPLWRHYRKKKTNRRYPRYVTDRRNCII